MPVTQFLPGAEPEIYSCLTLKRGRPEMTEHKSQPLVPGYPDNEQERNNGTQRNFQTADRGGRKLIGTDGRDVSGWDAYRRWLSRMQLPDKRRIAMDPALYTWKGYRNWAEKVRRDWTPEEK
jgi:hypothetical protein